MTDGPPPSTLRELRAHLGAPQVLAVQAGVAVLMGLSGPFDTLTSLSLPARLAYWTVIVFVTYGMGTALTVWLIDRWRPPALRVLGGSMLVGSVVVAVLAALNLLTFGWGGLAGHIAPSGLVGAYAVSAVVLALREVLAGPDAAPPAPAGGPPALLRRLPLDKRGDLVALAAEDHYVAVTTTLGRELVLMRLSDAIDEAAGTPGLRIHRSHWVALDQVRAASRQGDGAMLTLSDGSRVPVSRGRLAAVRKAGLLPG